MQQKLITSNATMHILESEVVINKKDNINMEGGKYRHRKVKLMNEMWFLFHGQTQEKKNWW